MPPSGDTKEILRLVQENNRILRSMRRHAFWGGIIKLIIYVVLLLAPVWFYMTYLNASVQRLIQTVDRVQGTGTKAQEQMNIYAQTLKDLEARLPAFMHPASTTQQ